MRKRIAALIIKDKKLLLVTGHRSSVFWSPGGKPKNNETHEECLMRELDEEINVKVKSAKYYFHQIVDPGAIIEGKKISAKDNYYYIVEIEGQIKSSNEIDDYRWFSKNDINSPNLQGFFKKKLIPMLTKDNLM
jgi:8-oxo-dGTP pyrophosphatase MutT (NUDIX family)